MMTPSSVVGFDLGRKYLAWTLIRKDDEGYWFRDRAGLLFPPDIGTTKNFGRMGLWRCVVDVFFRDELGPVDRAVAERFVYSPGPGGQSSEDINLRLSIMSLMVPELHLIRNTDWKGWFARTHNKQNTQEALGHMCTSPHEADSWGMALYGAQLPITG